MIDREEVYNAIDGERDYQDAMKGNSARENVDDQRDLGSLLVFMQTYLGKAMSGYSCPHPEGKKEALIQIRKVAALAVFAMEKHGVYLRGV